MSLSQWMSVVWSDQNPLLPDAVAMQWYLQAGWAVVLAGCAGGLLHGGAARMARQRQQPFESSALTVRMVWVVTLLLLLWVALPGSGSVSYWLGLAFGRPALVSVLLCAALWWRCAFARRPGAMANRWALRYAAAGVALGYVLLLDTLALLPVQLYAWGFSPAALALVLLASLLPCALLNPFKAGRVWMWFLPLSLLLFVLTRLPTGNVWDVVLDPLLWVGLQVYLYVELCVKARAR